MAGRIVVTGRVPEPALALLRSAGELDAHDQETALSVAELHAAIAGADAVVTLLNDRVDEAFLEAAGPQLRIVANVAVGYNNIDVPACARHGVLVTNTPGVLTDATADIAMALILMTMRRLGEGERVIRSQVGWRWHMHFMLGTSLQGKTLGIVGLGQIGTATARRARAFGMDIVYSGRRRGDAAVEAELGARFTGFDDLLATCDVVSLHCPLTPETTHLITAARLAQMRGDAYLVNTTRGPVVDEAALAEALRTGVIAGAGLDVFEREPEIHPALLELENAVLIPHLGSATIETRTAMAVLAARNAVAVLGGGEPLTPVSA
ncbi:MAG: glyoxylate reductase [Gaiellales bacterium]|nr:glyoxylate reductase [Gaiellales bacterium]